MSPFHIRDAVTADAAVIAAIYNHYVVNTTATFQGETVTATDIGDHIKKSEPCNRPYLVAESADGGSICGYCYADLMRSRCGYRHVVESSVYIAVTHIGGGVGSLLMQFLLARLMTGNAYKVAAVISLPNPASVALHEKLGFIHCGTLPAVGWKFGRWVDTGFWLKDLQKGKPDG